MPRNTKRSFFSRGLTLPGYNYLGPFNAADNGNPTNASDRIAKKHDQGYAMLQKEGKNPYIEYNDADEQAIQSWDSQTDVGGRIAKAVFRGKRGLASIGLIKDSTTKKQKIQGSFTTPEKTLKRGAPSISPDAVKKQKTQQPAEENESNESLSNSQSTAQASSMSANGGSGKDGATNETPVDDVGFVHRGPEDYTFATLPYIDERIFYGVANEVNHAFRMTSPYDPHNNLGTLTDVNTPGAGFTQVVNPADDPETTQGNARWFAFYAGIYNFYHVVACRYHVTFENLTTDPLYVHQMFYSDELPPNGADNHDIMLWRDAKSYYVGPKAYAITSSGQVEQNDQTVNGRNAEDVAMPTTPNYEAGNHVPSQVSSILKFSGEYRPGQFIRQIRQDDDVENWTAVTTNPKLPEKLLFRVKHASNSYFTNSASSSDRAFNYKWTIKLDYLVEFKELKAGLRWPVQRQPITVTILSNSSTSEGAGGN